jgi:hypothetical protein
MSCREDYWFVVRTTCDVVLPPPRVDDLNLSMRSLTGAALTSKSAHMSARTVMKAARMMIMKWVKEMEEIWGSNQSRKEEGK